MYIYVYTKKYVYFYATSCQLSLTKKYIKLYEIIKSLHCEKNVQVMFATSSLRFLSFKSKMLFEVGYLNIHIYISFLSCFNKDFTFYFSF